MSAVISKLMLGLKSQKRPGQFDAYPLMFELALHEPSQLGLFLRSVLDEYPAGGTFFNDAISYLPAGEFEDVVGHALQILRQNKQHVAAGALIAQTSLQCPQALLPHLTDLLDLGVNQKTYYCAYSWRGSGLAHFSELKRILESQVSSSEHKEFALEALFETRQPDALTFALETRAQADRPLFMDGLRGKAAEEIKKALAEMNELLADSGQVPAGEQSPFTEGDPDLLHIGYERCNAQFRGLYSQRARHLIFERDYLRTDQLPLHLKRQHPTWNLECASLPPVRFGGTGSCECSVCGGCSHHVLTMDPALPELGVTSVKRLSLEACLSCLGWEKSPLFYRHDSAGGIEAVGFEDKRIKPQFPAEPFLGTQVMLASTPERWFWQDWALSNSRQNLHRLGGHPCWIQQAEYLRCPDCGRTMQFLLQLDSKLPSGKGGFLWGSGGIAYGFWCDPCRISGFHWQCT